MPVAVYLTDGILVVERASGSARTSDVDDRLLRLGSARCLAVYMIYSGVYFEDLAT